MFKLYNYLPVSFQNFLITLKNIQVYNYKYGAIPFFKNLKEIQKAVISENYLINEQENVEKINKLLYDATNNTKFYKVRSNYYQKLDEINDLNQIPILEKEIIKKNNNEFISSNVSIFNAIKFKTSGTTGTPMYGFIRKKDLRKRFKIILKTMCLSGFDIQKKYARFVGKNIAPNGAVYRKDYINNHYFFSINRLSNRTVFDYYNAIVNNKIIYLEGYPSTINNLVNLFKNNNLEIKHVKGIYLTAEKLNDYQKENISSYFKCSVFDYYGSTEQSVYIYKPSSQETYECSNVTGYLEVVNNNGYLCKEGEEGDMIITSFTSYFTPLIRYRIGDRCVVSKINKNIDGSIAYQLSEIIGRNEESFNTIDGRIVSRFSLVLKMLPKEIILSQLYLSEKNNVVTLNYVSNHVIKITLFDLFLDKMQEFIGDGYEYKIFKITQVEKNPTGKIKTVFIEK